MIPKIYKITDEEDAKTLNAECSEVAINGEEMHVVARDLHLSMTVTNTKLAGLAAPQIGVPVRMFIMRWGAELLMFVNPVIVKQSKKTYDYREGCASCPDNYFVLTKRPKQITIEYYDMKEECRKNKTLKCRDAVIAQHEMDHLDGICIWDPESEAAKKVLEAKAAKKEAEANNSPNAIEYKNAINHLQSQGRDPQLVL